MTGLRWHLHMTDQEDAIIHWVIVKVPEGDSAKTISVTSASSLYNPEQNVIAAGTLMSVSSAASWDTGSTKAMRKLAAGDQLVFVYFVTVTTGTMGKLSGVIQYFLKE